MPALDLHPKHLRLLLGVLDRIIPQAEVWAYGSRVTHQAHEASDLDLVLRNPKRDDEPIEELRSLREALSESNLPILVDVCDWARLPDDMRGEIQRELVLLRSALVQTGSSLNPR